jgi:hypothetical protein
VKFSGRFTPAPPDELPIEIADQIFHVVKPQQTKSIYPPILRLYRLMQIDSIDD